MDRLAIEIELLYGIEENKIDWTKLKIVLEILNKTTLGKEKEFPITIYSINNNLTTR